MFQTILTNFVNVFYAAGNWFIQLFSSVPGSLVFVIAMFICFLSFRAILRPLIGTTPSAFHENRLPQSGGIDLGQSYSPDVYRKVWASPPDKFLPPPSIEHRD